MNSLNGRFLLGALLGLLFGGGLVFLLLGPVFDAPPPDLRLAPGGVASAETREAGERDELRAPVLTAKREAVVASSEPAAVSEERVTALVAELGDVAVHAEAGDGAIWGAVVDELGEPLANVVVQLDRTPRRRFGVSPEPGDRAPDPRSLREVVERAAQGHEDRRAYHQELRTGATGAYRFEGLADGEWNVQAYLEGYHFTFDRSQYRIPVGSEVGITGTRLIELPVQVYASDGTLAERAYLSCKPAGERSRKQRREWTAESSRVRLAPGTYEIAALSAERLGWDESTQSSEIQTVVVAAEGAGDMLRFDLRSRLGITGRITDGDGSIKTKYFYLNFAALAPGQEVGPDGQVPSSEQQYVRPGTTYSLQDLEPGRYWLGVSRNQAAPTVVHRVVEVTTGMEVCDLELPPVDRTKFLQVSVIDPDGMPLEGVSVSLDSPEIRTGYRDRSFALPGKDGTYLVGISAKLAEAYFGDAKPDATFKLTLNHNKYGRRDVEVARGQLELTYSYAVPGTLTVTVVGYQGSGYEGRLTVSATPEGERRGFGSFRRPGSDGMNTEGVQVITGLAAGSYHIALDLRSKGDTSPFAETNEIAMVATDVVAGANQVQLSIPALHVLRVRWADGKTGTSFYLARASDGEGLRSRGLRADLGEDGTAQFENVAAGEYTLSTGGRSSQNMRVTVPGGEVEFVPIEIDALSVVITDESGGFARVGLRSGDLIIGADGKEFVGRPSQSIFTEVLQSKAAVLRLLIERDGKQLELTIKGSDLGEGRDMGGRFLPASR